MRRDLSRGKRPPRKIVPPSHLSLNVDERYGARSRAVNELAVRIYCPVLYYRGRRVLVRFLIRYSAFFDAGSGQRVVGRARDKISRRNSQGRILPEKSFFYRSWSTCMNVGVDVDVCSSYRSRLYHNTRIVASSRAWCAYPSPA